MEVVFNSIINPPKQNQTESSNPIPVSSLISALDLAAYSTRTPSSSEETLAALRSAHRLIGSFLSQVETDKDEPMRDQGEEEEEGEGGDESCKIIEEVEEGMRECVLQTKRRKRRVSPSWIAGRAADRGEELSSVGPMDRRQSAIDLIFQFHA